MSESWGKTSTEETLPTAAELADIHTKKCVFWTERIAEKLRVAARDVEVAAAVGYGGERVTYTAASHAIEVLTAALSDVGWNVAHLTHQTALAQLWQERAKSCARCGIERAEGAQPLCRDCRSVLSKQEREAWAA